MTTPNIVFQHIIPRLGSTTDTFEKLCCYLARNSIKTDQQFVVLNGAGGDGGVECYAISPDGSESGWQAKYVWNITSLITQASESLQTALNIHPKLKEFYICFPFDFTGKTGRKGKSQLEKFEEWRLAIEQTASKSGRTLKITTWSASKLRELLIQYDVSGGVRQYYFNRNILTKEWFTKHLEEAHSEAGPRYTPELNVETPLWKHISTFGLTSKWEINYRTVIRGVALAVDEVRKALQRDAVDSLTPPWPVHLQASTQILVLSIEDTISLCEVSILNKNSIKTTHIVAELRRILNTMNKITSSIYEELKTKYKDDNIDSPGFRQWHAEYMVSFPLNNLDIARRLQKSIEDLLLFISSIEGKLTSENVFLITGDAGTGKTHSICDSALLRLNDGQLSVVLYGHVFSGNPDPWTRIIEKLGLQNEITKEALLDSLNAAGEAASTQIILFIDAINETRPISYWQNNLTAFIYAVSSRPFLRLCLTCRTSYTKSCVPEGIMIASYEHKGFSGCEHIACKAFFKYYNLDPPIIPILPPEFSNPLYLRLLCETLVLKGLSRIQPGVAGIRLSIEIYLLEMEKKFSHEYETHRDSHIVIRILQAIVQGIIDSCEASIPYHIARQIADNIISINKQQHPVDWLIGTNLLILDAPIGDSILTSESTIRPSFERLGDFLLAFQINDKCKLKGLIFESQNMGLLHRLWKNENAIAENSSVISALCVIIPEENPEIEFPNLCIEKDLKKILVRHFLASLPSRLPQSFTINTLFLLQEALKESKIMHLAIDSILSIGFQHSEIDAKWFDEFLKMQPLAIRDAVMCMYLHESYDKKGPVHLLVDNVFQLDIQNIETEVALRWAILLLWFTSAADRRVKDNATRATVELMKAHPCIVPELLNMFIRSGEVDDDTVKERVILCSYGALLLTRDSEVIPKTCMLLHDAYTCNPLTFDNALIRDHIHCICELALELKILPEGIEPDFTMQPIQSEWPLELPSDEDIVNWAKTLRFHPDELSSDFFKYSMNCLRPWIIDSRFPGINKETYDSILNTFHGEGNHYAITKADMGKLILKKATSDSGYIDSACQSYDNLMINEHGMGRSNGIWPERIGKKYMWTALYQLASRLHDHLEQRKDQFIYSSSQESFILLEERKLDPTISLFPRPDYDNLLWFNQLKIDIDSTLDLSDDNWISKKNDIPSVNNILEFVSFQDKQWLILNTSQSFNTRKENQEYNKPYRDVWYLLNSYIVKNDDVSDAFNALQKRNLYGRWMPEGSSFLYVFAGEYPWGISYGLKKTLPDDIHHYVEGLPINFIPSSHIIVGEWEYDATLEESRRVTVPDSSFFTEENLWWNGIDGFKQESGQTVFRDIIIDDTGRSMLIADIDYLSFWLSKNDMSILWTLLGGKQIINQSRDEETLWKTFSQIAIMDSDKVMNTGKLVFFNDPNEKVGISTRNMNKS